MVAVAAASGWHLHAVRPSRLPGPAGNREFFVLLRSTPPAQPVDLVAAVPDAPSG